MLPLERRYLLIGEPRAGSVGSIWTARDRLTGRICVLKLAPAGTTGADRLLREAGLLADLGHPRLIGCLERVVEAPGPERVPMSGFSMPWRDASRLDEVAGTLSVDERVGVLGGLLDAVAYLHARGILHLDLKPSNVLVDEAGPVLLDLGTAQRIEDAEGSSGGTLGYAAPEVLGRRTPTVQADLFGLGVLAYELLAGRTPFAGDTPELLKQAILSGEIIPLRAAAPQVPRPLAQLVQQLLEVDPLKRPPTAEAVWEALEAQGWELPVRHQGKPPLLGRERELDDLLELLEDGSSAAVLAEPGAGRDRLVRGALWRLRLDASHGLLDLSSCADPVRVLHTLLTLDAPEERGAELSAREAVRARLRRPVAWQGRIYVGRAERLDPTLREDLLQLQPALRERGIGLLWTAEAGLRGTRPFYLKPLGAGDLRRLGQFLGISQGSTLRELAEVSRGRPGAMIDAALLDRVQLPEPLATRYRSLCTLPSGAPPALVERLGEDWRQAVHTLQELGLARQRADGGLVLLGAQMGGRLAPELAAEVAPLAERLELEPVWRGLLACRLGRLAEAAEVVETLLADGQVPPAASAELLEAVARDGHPQAARALCRVRRADGDLQGALDALDLAPHRSHLGARLEVLHLLDRRDEALAVLEASRPEERDHEAWVQAGWCLYRKHRFEEIEGCLEQAEALAPGHPEALALHLIWYDKFVEDPEDRAERVEQRLSRYDLDELPCDPLFTAGRILMRTPRLGRGIELLERASLAADRAADLAFAAPVRLTLGNAMIARGDGRRARRALNEGLIAGRAAGLPEVQIRGLYTLVELEIRSGRLDAAERALGDYQEVARSVDRADVRIRGWILQGMLADRREDHAALLALTEAPEAHQLPKALSAVRDLFLAKGLLGLGRPVEALEAAQRGAKGPPTGATFHLIFDQLLGRCHLAVARKHLAAARAEVPEQVDALNRHLMGEVLLAAAGEDLDPSTFLDRRHDLDRAASMLRGEGASRAATLRDRMLASPGAGLEGIAELLETVNDPRVFPKVLARLVSEALGANRVLILMRIPGLGRQVGFIELGQQEVAGISQEVMRRIVHADDVWLAGDAFGDPAIREISATVRSFEIRSVLAVAIPRGEEAVGALYVDDLHRQHRFSQEDVAILKRLASAASHLIGMMTPGARPSTTLEEPQDLLGVLLSDSRQVQEMQLALDMLRSHQDRPVNLLITGATGTGKTWLARRITREILERQADPVEHAMRNTDPDKLISALAGTRRGEFTGAVEKQGAIRKALAAKTSLFLDEIQALDDRGQTALLPLLELPERRFSGLTGAAGRITEPLCIILGTNVDVSAGRWRQHFRQDLWFRMSQVHVHLPTLAERGPEVVYRYLVNQLQAEGLDVPPEEVLEPPALQHAVSWSWPGNLRELVSAAQEIAFFYRRDGRPLTLAELSSLRAFRQQDEDGLTELGAPMHVRDAFVEQVWRVLPRYRWNQSEVARALNCSVSKVNRALKAAGLLDEVRLNRARRGQP